MRRLPLFLILASGCPRGAPPAVAVTAPQDLTIEVLNRWTEEVCELIEEESGGTFVTLPHVRLATPTEIRQVVVDEAVKIEVSQRPDLSERAVRARYGEQPVLGIMGKYGIFTDVMYVDVDTVWQVAAQLGAPEKEAERVTKVLLAHELTHALQAQYGNASAHWFEVPDADALEALRSVTEGQATWVEQRVGSRLAADDVVEAMIAAQGWSFQEGPVHPAAFRIWSAYGQGAVWMQALFESGGTDAQWQAVRHPPAESAVVFGTKPYGTEATPVPATWKQQYRGLEHKLGQGSWVVSESRLGEVHLRESLFAIRESITPYLAALQAGWTRDAALPDREVRLQRLRFASEGEAAGFLGALGDRPETRPDERITELELGDGAVHIVSGPGLRDAETSSASMEVDATWVRVGNDVLALHCARFRPGLRSREVLTAMLSLVEEE